MFCILILAISLVTCCNNKPSDNQTVNSNQHKSIFQITAPAQNTMIPLKDSLLVEIKIKNKKKITLDSVEVFCSGQKIYSSKKAATGFHVYLPSDLRVGRQSLKVQVHYNAGEKQSKAAGLILLSDIEPVKLKYEILRKIAHDTDAYTQGLVYFKDMLYEGTGRVDNSTLRKIDPSDGKVLKKHALESKYFGEGIAILNNKIYQLTYKSGLGFIYTLDDFKPVRRFNLQTYEGWGLTTDGNMLMMSDGSSQIYFLDPEYLTMLRQIQVMSNKGEVNMLNELEYVNGKLYANIYGRSNIAKIDIETGKVLGFLDLSALFPEGYEEDMDTVLNGIAYNPKTNSFFVTGKLWPVMYEIKITE